MELKIQPEQRQWLDEIARSMTLSTRDTILAFMREFDLSPSQAGEILAQWIQEQ